jgi:hypothetical protein
LPSNSLASTPYLAITINLSGLPVCLSCLSGLPVCPPARLPAFIACLALSALSRFAPIQPSPPNSAQMCKKFKKLHKMQLRTFSNNAPQTITLYAFRTAQTF